MKMGQQILQGQLCTLEFEQVFQLSQGRLKEALVSELKALGYKPTSKKGFLYASGEVPVMLIAHMDTVHRQLAEHICYTEDSRIMMSPEDIGGDDRAGIYRRPSAMSCSARTRKPAAKAPENLHAPASARKSTT